MRTNFKVLTLLLSLVLVLSLFTQSSFSAECVRADPQVTIIPDSLTAPSGTTAIYSVKATNMDTTECTANTFTITTDIDPSKIFIHPTSLTLEPGKTGTFTLEINIPADADAKTSTFKTTVKSGVYEGSDTATLTVKKEPTTCTLTVDSITLQKSDENIAKSTFIFGDLVRVLSQVSLSGKTTENVDVILLVNGKVFDSKTIQLVAKTTQSISFDRLIDTKEYGISSPTVKVQAKTTCDVDGAENTKTFSIQTSDKCYFSTTVGTPGDVKVGDTISTKILIENGGAKDDFVLLQAFLCKEDESDCSGMICDSTRIDVKKDDVKSVYCLIKASETGKYRIKANVVACEKQDIQFSKIFNVNPTGIALAALSCTEGYLDNYRCNGNFVQREYQNKDCSKYWTAVDLCSIGCDNGNCVGELREPVTVAPGQYEIKLKREYQAKVCDVSSFVFDVENKGQTRVIPALSVSGKAADWIYVSPTVSVAPEEKKPVTAYASIPCDVKTGNYEFTITASDGVVYAATSGLEVIGAPMIAVDTLIFSSVTVVVILLLIITLKKTKVLRYFVGRKKVEEF